LEIPGRFRKLFLAHVVIAFLNARARFLQRYLRRLDRRASSRERAAGHSRAFGSLQSLFGAIERRRDLAEPALRRTAKNRLLGGCFLGRSLGPIAAVQRIVQREPIVALRDRLLRALQRLDGGVVLLGGVAIGTRGPCGIDRALGLIHLSRWRRGATRGEKRRAEKRETHERNTTRHLFEYSLCTEVRRCSPEGEPRRDFAKGLRRRARRQPDAMKTLSVNDRPREKLFRLGAAGLGDNELVAIVVGSGSRRANALALANDILETTSGLHGMPRTSVDELRRIDGMGAAKAAQVLAAVELGRRTLLRCPPARLQFVNPRDAAAFLLPQFGSRPVEQFGLMMLDTKHRLIRTSIVSVGTLDSSPAHPREIFREAASACAAAIVLFHNHPSGDPLPSRDDVELTRRLVQAGEIMGIDVIDHVILADTRYFSFREAGKL
jgi:DNA repair protein RadC